MGVQRWISHEPEPTEPEPTEAEPTKAEPTKARPAKPGRPTRRPRRTARRWRTKARPARRWRTEAGPAWSSARTRRPARRRRTTQAGPAGRPTALRVTFYVPLPRPCAGDFFGNRNGHEHVIARLPPRPRSLSSTQRLCAFVHWVGDCTRGAPEVLPMRRSSFAAPRMLDGAAARAELAGTPASIAR